jgi:glucose dehydrogenase
LIDAEDVLLLLGVALVVTGVALLSTAAAFIVAGLAFVVIAFARSRRPQADRPRRRDGA